jgi:hypothetical protein
LVIVTFQGNTEHNIPVRWNWNKPNLDAL